MQEEGYIAKLLFPEGAKDVKLGTVVAIVVDSKDDVAKFKDYSGSAATPTPAAPKKEAEKPKAASTQAAAVTPQKAVSTSGRVFVSPLAKKLAEEQGLDLAGVSGSGPNGRILKSDVDSAL
jgi:pyruvate dehydrogenase E2 component (dihydrolipoamide acetyltransferase)